MQDTCPLQRHTKASTLAVHLIDGQLKQHVKVTILAMHLMNGRYAPVATRCWMVRHIAVGLSLGSSSFGPQFGRL